MKKTPRQLAALKRWKNPEYRTKQEAAKQRPEYKKKIKRSAKVAANRPEPKQRKIDAVIERWANPKYKKRVGEAISEGLLKSSDKLSENQLRLWGIPKERKKRLAWRDDEEKRLAHDQRVRETCGTEKHRKKLSRVASTPEEKARRSLQATKQHREGNLGQRHPNQSEINLLAILKSINKKFMFVGNGKFWVGNKNPDFVLSGEMALVEFNGSYWHQDKVADRKRKKEFEKAGYRVLIFSEVDLAKKNLEKTIEAIRCFVAQGNPEPSRPKSQRVGRKVQRLEREE